MDKALFKHFMQSIKEAGQIRRGKRRPARPVGQEFRHRRMLSRRRWRSGCWVVYFFNVEDV